jgi:hypothetical protein
MSGIVDKAVEIEKLLKGLGYEGRGLHELLTQAEPALDVRVVRAGRRIASIRNKAAHEGSSALSQWEVGRFNEAYEYVRAELRRLTLDRLKTSDPRSRNNEKAAGTAKPSDPAAEKMTWKEILGLGAAAVAAAGLWFLNEIRN